MHLSAHEDETVLLKSERRDCHLTKTFNTIKNPDAASVRQFRRKKIQRGQGGDKKKKVRCKVVNKSYLMLRLQIHNILLMYF